MAILEYVGYNRKLKPHKKWDVERKRLAVVEKIQNLRNVHECSFIMLYQKWSSHEVATGRTQWELPSEGAAALSDRQYDDLLDLTVQQKGMSLGYKNQLNMMEISR